MKMKLSLKLIILNILMPMILLVLLVVFLQVRSRRNAEEQAQEELIFQLNYAVAKIEEQLTEKEQYLQDQARLYSTVELYYNAIDSYDENEWEAVPAFRRWRQEFAGGQALEDDVMDTYVGYAGTGPALSPQWLPIPVQTGWVFPWASPSISGVCRRGLPEIL
jgi:hypothetical protein